MAADTQHGSLLLALIVVALELVARIAGPSARLHVDADNRLARKHVTKIDILKREATELSSWSPVPDRGA